MRKILALALSGFLLFGIQPVAAQGVSPSGTGSAPLTNQVACYPFPLVTQIAPCVGFINNLRVVIAAGAVTVATTDGIVVVNKTSGAATIANLYATPATNSVVIIKDGKGDAAANPITVTPAAGNIDGAGTYVINTNFGAAEFVYNGTQWNVLPISIGQLGANSVLANWTAAAALPLSKTYPSCADTAGNHLNYVNGTGITCGTTSSSTPLSGTTASIGGSPLLAGACSAGTATVTGATSSMSVAVSPSADPDSTLSTGIAIYGFVSSSNTVTVRVCAIVAVTPTAVTYNVRAIQ